MENLINLQQEIWVNIADFENYEVSTYGEDIIWLCQEKNDKQYCQKVHRIIALHFIPNPQYLKCVDHKNSQKKDNFISNLRWVTVQQNNMNAKKRKNTSSQFKGVTFNQNLVKWKATIKINGELQYLGNFTNEEEAGIAYDVQAIQHFGEFAKTNFPLENYQQQNNQQ